MALLQGARLQDQAVALGEHGSSRRAVVLHALLTRPDPATYFALRSLDSQVAVTQATLEGRQESLRLVRRRSDAGVASDLDVRQQELLSRWIALHAPSVQVLALAREPLFESVADGRFSAALYYRINTVVVEVRAAADLP